MVAIFYDLETSDRHAIGQILNFSFIEVDSQFSIISECPARIRVSRLQLPDPEAILVNRTHLLQHQAQAEYTEVQALLKIQAYISEVIKRHAQKVCLVGFNSARFDLAYLRTSFIRNGIDPYFSGALLYKDLLHLAKKLSVSRADFPRLPHPTKPKLDVLSLALETLGKHFGLIEDAQAHESRADVILSIKLASLFKERFQLNVLDYQAYELNLGPASNAKVGDLFFQALPEYDLKTAVREVAPSYSAPQTLLYADYRYALWLDLKRYAEFKDRRAISWHNFATHAFVTGETRALNNEEENLRAEALLQFKSLTLAQFFAPCPCDIEVDIHRLDFGERERFNTLIRSKDARQLFQDQNLDLRNLYFRYWLANYEPGSESEEIQKFEQVLKRYALLRYSGDFSLSKSSEREAAFQQNEEKHFQPSFAALFDRLQSQLHEREATKAEREQESLGQDCELLLALKEYYLSSDIFRVAAHELRCSHWARPGP